MRQGIGSVFLYNLIIIFIFLLFTFLAGTVSYAKAFRVNSKIVSALETYEGYNILADDEIYKKLKGLGYKYNYGNRKACPKRDVIDAVIIDKGESVNYDYCIYLIKVDDYHFTYGVLTYMDLDFPIVGDLLRIPVYSKTKRIFRFG